MKQITEKKFRGVVRKAFSLGRWWGECYHGWFHPSKKDHRKKEEEAIKICRQHLMSHQQEKQ